MRVVTSSRGNVALDTWQADVEMRSQNLIC
jgi:hypothetical protein